MATMPTTPNGKTARKAVRAELEHRLTTGQVPA
jgi:hypothetical protein